MVRRKSSAKTARTKTDRLPTRAARVQKPSIPVLDAAVVADRLTGVVHSLSHSLSVLMVSVEALRRQDADADADIAVVLQQNVGDKMDMAIDELWDLADLADKSRPVERETEGRVVSAKAA